MRERNSVADTMARSSAVGGGGCFKTCSKIDLNNIAESEDQKKRKSSNPCLATWWFVVELRSSSTAGAPVASLDKSK